MTLDEQLQDLFAAVTNASAALALIATELEDIEVQLAKIARLLEDRRIDERAGASSEADR